MDKREMTMKASELAAQKLGMMSPPAMIELMKEIKSQPEVYDRLLKWQKADNQVRAVRGDRPLNEQQMANRMIFQYLLDKELEVMKANQA